MFSTGLYFEDFLNYEGFSLFGKYIIPAKYHKFLHPQNSAHAKYHKVVSRESNLYKKSAKF